MADLRLLDPPPICISFIPISLTFTLPFSLPISIFDVPKLPTYSGSEKRGTLAFPNSPKREYRGNRKKTRIYSGII